MLVTVQRYRRATGDSTTPDSNLTTVLAEGQLAVEEHLRRPLESAQRTEVLRRYGSRIYPKATPVTAAEGFTIKNGVALLDPSPTWDAWSPNVAEVTVTYTGGYTAANVPTALADAIIATAKDRLFSTSEYPAGASAVSVGDAKITFKEGVIGEAGPVPSDVTASIAKYKRRYL